MNRSIEHSRISHAVVKSGLAALGLSQRQAARQTRQSPALVSMVLAGKAVSAPCLEKLARLIARRNGR